MKFVPDIRNWWRWASVRLIMVASAFEAAWFALPHEFKMDAPEWLRTIILLSILGAAFFGRLIKQDLPEE